MQNKFLKLTNAVYRLLDFFPEDDPLRNRIKEKALSIMEDLTLIFNDDGWVSIGDFLSQSREKVKIHILEDIKVLLNYLEIAKSQGWLSDINFFIISREYEKIKKDTGFPVIIENQTQKLLEPVLNTTLGGPGNKAGGHQFFIAKNAEKEFSGRQNKIIEFLERNQKAQVADLMAVLPKVTKRTVRRDLDELLKKGKIKRQGEFNRVFYKLYGQ